MQVQYIRSIRFLGNMMMAMYIFYLCNHGLVCWRYNILSKQQVGQLNIVPILRKYLKVFNVNIKKLNCDILLNLYISHQWDGMTVKSMTRRWYKQLRECTVYTEYATFFGRNESLVVLHISLNIRTEKKLESKSNLKQRYIIKIRTVKI